MATSWALSRSLERIGYLCRDVLDDRELRREVLAELGKVVPFSAFAWPLTDPESATGISPMARIPCPDELPELIRLKYLTADARWTSLMGQRRPATTLLMATGGRPARSRLWNGLLIRYGVTDVLSVVFADKHGCWGWLDLWRGGDEGTFSEPETDFLATAAPLLAAGLRRSRAAQWQRDVGGGAGARTAVGKSLPPQAVLVLDERLAVRGQTATAGDWLGLLQRGPRPYEGIPAEVLNVAAQLLAREAGVDAHQAMSRVPVGHGAWALLRSARMDPGKGGAPPLAVTIQECPAADRLEAFARCFALTPQQHRLLGLAAGGLSTSELAAALQIRPYTVQDLFKAVFVACGVRSRGALLGLALGAAAVSPTAASASDGR
ncbi:LuxR family transcriptional regulator [Arthrobacter sp. C9C5]|uniref:helix-turn-helix transcriptional regulator n=1 Tax=Arthrobacter sp. C9C5 TaxID=2735267 RepID=UPI001585C8EC|nr:LuxR family transcriptional regulator [Arthrobacter sp. C9C5]NUU32450.1 LuxR family transcriptional regulator [Arthrobacter sp. C9C5]